jgi:hypothetical protein
MFFGAALFYPISKNVAHAQQATQDMSGVTSNNFIDGRKNPELIRDVDAYRLFLLAAVASDNSAVELDRQKAIFAFLNLTDSQFAQVHQILADYKTLVDSSVEEYNQSAITALAGSHTVSLKPFLAKRDWIVLETVSQLKTVIGNDGSEPFTRHVQHEKLHMRIGIEDSLN